MPPALSDEDERSQSSGDEQIPAKIEKGGKKAEPVEEVEEGSDEEGAEDEYVVEKILDHKKSRGVIVYEVKWQGYPDPSDRTWEPKDNLMGALDVLHEYWDAIGGDPGAGQGKKRKGRKSAAGSESATPAVTNKKIKKEVEWEPPKGSWEHDVDQVETVEELRDPTTGKLGRFAYLVWKNHRKTQHPLAHVYQKCPQKMLAYYESHLVFSHSDEDLNGENNVSMGDAEKAF
ncbi:hypothetical protein CC80DRAFT_478324 [Byssothecium circinans]|uniref:Chromo domain-containing protein n=1 Tax=Byssothecium circinans TaxID=147558 RepID=A0A6A5TMT4_9PLEO|nr:hypothetical protein CC80DRAFT_478324 [Byssothecium circinans]